jgi:peptide-methionine (S)-S-oxide reductase
MLLSVTAMLASDFPDPAIDAKSVSATTQTAVVAGGCFWCTEAVFVQIEGVEKVVSGYSGGDRAAANYEAVCGGKTGHAEAIQITYDPSRISYGRLLKIFFSVAHDPTQLNRQGHDVGTQYRSAIFYSDPEQKQIAEAYVKQLDEAKVFRSPIVTEVTPLKAFYPAEEYHQDYCSRNPHNPYVASVAEPKVEKTKQHFPELLKK